MNNRPKRKKSKDNPYTLQIINNTYIVVFKDGANKEQAVEVNEEVFKEMNRFELEDISQMHKIEKYLDKYSYIDEVLYQKSVNKSKMIEGIVEEKIINEKLREAISSLSPVQKRRLKMYFFDGLTQQEISKIEKISIRAVQYTMNNAILKLKDFLKN